MNAFTQSWLAAVLAGAFLGAGMTPWALWILSDRAVAFRDIASRGREPASLRLEPFGRPLPPRPPSPPGACPEDMVFVSGTFCSELRYICRSGASEDERCTSDYLRGVPCKGEQDYRRYCIDRFEWPNRVGESPEVFVNWEQAKEKCRAAGKRLCRRSEWVLACEGPKRMPFPWGFRRQPSPCNIDRTPIPFDEPAMEREETREGELARLWQADPIGSHPDCVSSYGAFDMSGNVDEWTDNELDDPDTNRPSTLNGGYWGPVRDTCRLTTKSHGPLFRFYQVGFRCCRDTGDGVEVPPPRRWIEADRPDERPWRAP
jgi:formylglycine-generating enzyme